MKTATVTPQKFLEKTLKLGERRRLLAVGLDADLLLVEGKPLTDVATIRHALGLMFRGKWYPAERVS